MNMSRMYRHDELGCNIKINFKKAVGLLQNTDEVSTCHFNGIRILATKRVLIISGVRI